MTRRLFGRFFVVGAVSVAFLIILTVGMMQILNFCNVSRKADETLQVLWLHGGMILHDKEREPAPNMQRPRPDEDVPYKIRYFKISFDRNGAFIAADMRKIVGVTREEALDAAQAIRISGKEKGYWNVYRYLVIRDRDGDHVLFLDCATELSSCWSYLRVSAAIAAAGYLAALVFVLLIIRRALIPIQESMERQRQFVTDAGHELKTPLAIILANTEVLEMTCGENQWLASTRRQAMRMDQLVQNLLALAKVDEQQARLEHRVFPLGEAAAACAESFATMAAAAGLRMRLEIERTLRYCGDSEKLRELMGILLDNAVKYTPPGGEILFSVKRHGRTVILREENDCGQAPTEDLSRLFDRFYRADSSRNQATGGSGIGLAIARAIVQAHNGKISAAMTDQGKICFTVQLP